MSKYIRTKDERIVERGIITFKCGNFINNRNKVEVIYYDNILQEADTIEELCDMYVLKNKENGKHRICSPFEVGLKASIYEVYGVESQEIYGAIWTDKGLIYVAKMNKDGVLELI